MHTGIFGVGKTEANTKQNLKSIIWDPLLLGGGFDVCNSGCLAIV